MPRRIEAPTVIPAAGTRPKVIEEYVGRVNTGHGSLSIARMKSPSGWTEPSQTPEFEEFTVAAAAVWRRGFDVFHCALPLHEAAALRAALDGGTLGAICAHFADRPDPAGEAHEAMASWFGERWVASVAPLPTEKLG